MTVLQQAATRSQVREALDGLEVDLPDGTAQTVHAFLTMPPAVQPLDTWTQWSRTDWINAYNHRTTWNVVVVLPQTMPADPELDDAVAAAIGSRLALKVGGVVGPAQPIGVRLTDVAGTTVPAVSIQLVV